MQLEPQEAVDKLRLTLKVLGTFKSYYFEYKGRSSIEMPANPWRVQTTALFGRLDSFMERCHDVLELCNTTVQFNRLERVEIGGSNGRQLSNCVRAIQQDFNQAAQHFQGVKYDVIDIGEQRFTSDFHQFRWVVKDLERRLASVITQVGARGCCWPGGGSRGLRFVADADALPLLASCSPGPSTSSGSTHLNS